MKKSALSLLCVLFSLAYGILNAFCQIAFADTPYISPYIRNPPLLADIVAIPESSKDTLDRHMAIQSLTIIVENDDLAKTNRRQVLRAIERLVQLRAIEAIPAISRRIDLGPGALPPDTSQNSWYPVVGALTSLCMVAPEEATAKLIEEIVLNQYPDNNKAISGVLNTPARGYRKVLLDKFVREYELQALRQKTLSDVLNVAGAPSISTVPIHNEEAAPLLEVADEKAELVRYYDALPILKNEKLTIVEDEAKAIAAVEELGQLHLAQVVPILVSKLNAEVPEPVEKLQVKTLQFLRVQPQGLLSPAIAQSAAQALLQIGKPALPALTDAVAARGSSVSFRESALKLIVQIAGDEKAAQGVLSQAAEENQSKAERLRALAASLPQEN